MKRSEERDLAFQILFESQFDTEITPAEHYQTAILERNVEMSKYVMTVLNGVKDHLDEIDSTIESYSTNWKKDRISKVSFAVLRLACFEMFYMPDIPLKVSLNEGINLTKKYDDEKAYGFVNGVLNQILHDKRSQEKS